MKKFLKFCLITAAILIIIGLILGIAGSVAGGNREIARMARNGELTFDSDFFRWGFWAFDDDEPRLTVIDEHLDEHLYDLDEIEVFDEDREIQSGDISFSRLPVSDIRRLHISLGGGEFAIRQSEDENFYLEAKNADRLQVYGENNTLYLKAIRTRVHHMDTVISLYIPEEPYEELELALGAGVLRLQDALAFLEADIEVGAGQMFLENLTCNSLTVEVGAGELIGKNLTVRESADWSVGVGHLQVQGTVEGDLDVACSMGSAELTLADEEAAFNYEIECAAGTIQVGGTEFAGLSAEKSLYNHAKKDMNLDCQMGAIEVTFER